MNNENLVQNKNLAPSQRRVNASKAGKASGKARRKRKAFKDVFNSLLQGELSSDLAMALNEKTNTLGIDTDDFTVNDYIALAQVIKAISGDTKAFEVIRDTVGEKPKDRKEVEITKIPKINIIRGGSNE